MVQNLDRRERFEIILSTHNEAGFNRRAIQYVHFPWVYLPRPEIELRWYHRIPGLLTRRFGPIRGVWRLKWMLVPANICRDAGREICPYPARFGASAKWQGSAATYVGWYVIYCGWHELETLGVMADFLEPGMRVIEVGANEGYHTIFAGACVGSTGRVTAYEPSPRERDRLIANVALNHFEDRVVVRDSALSDYCQSSSFLVPLDDEWNKGVGSLAEHYQSPEKVSSIQVRVATVDTEELGDCEFMKLDVQGAEASVWRGAVALLERCQPVVYFEVEGDERGAVEFLERLGYKVWRVHAAAGDPTIGCLRASVTSADSAR